MINTIIIASFFLISSYTYAQDSYQDIPINILIEELEHSCEVKLNRKFEFEKEYTFSKKIENITLYRKYEGSQKKKKLKKLRNNNVIAVFPNANRADDFSLVIELLHKSIDAIRINFKPQKVIQDILLKGNKATDQEIDALAKWNESFTIKMVEQVSNSIVQIKCSH